MIIKQRFQKCIESLEIKVKCVYTEYRPRTWFKKGYSRDKYIVYDCDIIGFSMTDTRSVFRLSVTPDKGCMTTYFYQNSGMGKEFTFYDTNLVANKPVEFTLDLLDDFSRITIQKEVTT